VDFTPEELKTSIRSLIKLQEIDGILFKLNEELKLPPGELVGIKNKSEETQKAMRNAERMFRAVDRERRAIELRLITLQEDLKRAETKRREVKNTKEEFSANKEFENFQRKLADFKKMLEEKESAVEEKQALLTEKKAEFEALEAKLKSLEETRNKRLEDLKYQLDEHNSKRREYISHVQGDIFSMYERVQKLRRGSGVALVKDGTCTGCFVSVPPQLSTNLAKLDRLITCSSCSRILYPEVLLESQEVENTEAVSLKSSSA